MAIRALTSLRMAWVQAFLAVVINGSFSAAARAIGCNQSTVSRDVGLLEDFLGVKLFERGPQATLTEAGKAFLTKADAIMDLWREALELKNTLSALDASSSSAPPPQALKRLWQKWFSPPAE